MLCGKSNTIKYALTNLIEEIIIIIVGQKGEKKKTRDNGKSNNAHTQCEITRQK